MSETAGVIEYLDVDQIEIIDDHNPRFEFNQEKLLDLGKSMQENTQLAPIIVHKNDEGKYDLIAGERRLRAAINVGQKNIEARVFDGLSRLRMIQMMLAENGDRVSLNVIEEAYGYSKLMEQGVGIEQIAASERRSTDYIRKRLDLLQLDEDVQDMVVREQHPLPIHQALVLKKLAKNDQYKIAQKAAPTAGPVASEQQVREWVEDIINPPLPVPEDESETDQADAEEKTIEPDKFNPDGPDEQNQQQKDDAEERANSKALEKAAAEVLKLKPVPARVGVEGKLSVNRDGFACLQTAVMSFNINGKVYIRNIPMQDLNFEGDDLKELISIIEENQPKPPKKKKAVKKKK